MLQSHHGSVRWRDWIFPRPTSRSRLDLGPTETRLQTRQPFLNSQDNGACTSCAESNRNHLEPTISTSFYSTMSESFNILMAIAPSKNFIDYWGHRRYILPSKNTSHTLQKPPTISHETVLSEKTKDQSILPRDPEASGKHMPGQAILTSPHQSQPLEVC